MSSSTAINQQQNLTNFFNSYQNFHYSNATTTPCINNTMIGTSMSSTLPNAAAVAAAAMAAAAYRNNMYTSSNGQATSLLQPINFNYNEFIANNVHNNQSVALPNLIQTCFSSFASMANHNESQIKHTSAINNSISSSPSSSSPSSSRSPSLTSIPAPATTKTAVVSSVNDDNNNNNDSESEDHNDDEDTSE